MNRNLSFGGYVSQGLGDSMRYAIAHQLAVPGCDIDTRPARFPFVAVSLPVRQTAADCHPDL